MNWQPICDHISAATNTPFVLKNQRVSGGGCINQSYVLESKNGQRYFVKLNRREYADMFVAEAEGLAEIVASATVRVPAPLCWGESAGHAYLVLEYLDLRGSADGARLGEQLVAMHRVQGAYFGWHRDNTIGTTPQHNRARSDWLEFWRDQRLGFQLELAARNGYGGVLQSQGETLLTVLADFFDGYSPQPSLLHGDLWSGNQANAGCPVLFDPAVYYGDREIDIAMSELFGGFPPAFYQAYQSAWPLDPGYKTRKTLYNLYHILNHLNLFGGAYLGQAVRMSAALLQERRG
jgi:protein-ribulosamine 3-kinase